MALTKEDLQAIKGLLKDELRPIKEELEIIKVEQKIIKVEQKTVKEEQKIIKEELTVIKQKVTKLELMVENEINHSIQLLAENHINLIDKLNQAIRVSDKTLMYEVQVLSLKLRVEQLEKAVDVLKDKTA